MNEQNQNIEPVVQINKRPVWITILAILTFVISFNTILFPFMIGAEIGTLRLSDFAFAIKTDPFFTINQLLQIFILPITLIVAAIGLLKMRRWALYTFLIVLIYDVVVAIIAIIKNPLAVTMAFYLIIYILIAIYLWKIRKQFN